MANCKIDAGWPGAVHEVSRGKVVVYGVFFKRIKQAVDLY